MSRAQDRKRQCGFYKDPLKGLHCQWGCGRDWGLSLRSIHFHHARGEKHFGIAIACLNGGTGCDLMYNSDESKDRPDRVNVKTIECWNPDGTPSQLLREELDKCDMICVLCHNEEQEGLRNEHGLLGHRDPVSSEPETGRGTEVHKTPDEPSYVPSREDWDGFLRLAAFFPRSEIIRFCRDKYGFVCPELAPEDGG